MNAYIARKIVWSILPEQYRDKYFSLSDDTIISIASKSVCADVEDGDSIYITISETDAELHLSGYGSKGCYTIGFVSL